MPNIVFATKNTTTIFCVVPQILIRLDQRRFPATRKRPFRSEHMVNTLLQMFCIYYLVLHIAMNPYKYREKNQPTPCCVNFPLFFFSNVVSSFSRKPKNPNKAATNTIYSQTCICAIYVCIQIYKHNCKHTAPNFNFVGSGFGLNVLAF